MCKYCKRLKRFKDLDEKEYKRIIYEWRLRDREARKFLSNYKVLLFELLEKREIFGFGIFDILAFSDQTKRVDEFLNRNWIGK